MTREEAKDLFRLDRNSYGGVRAPIAKIDKIFDDFEKEDTRLGCPMNKCKHFKDGQIIGECLNCCRNYYDMFEERK